MCLSPLHAWYKSPANNFDFNKPFGRYDKNGITGDIIYQRKLGITFKASNAWLDRPVEIPCGKCAECIKKKRSDWANRIYLESKCHDKNCFITLTYNPENLPVNEDGKAILVKNDLVLFMKRLRKELSKRGTFIRFYAVGEYGRRRMRPHFHLVIFGEDFSFDRKVLRPNGRFIDYVSDVISRCWTYGYHTINDFSYSNARYIAGYVSKKVSDTTDYEALGLEKPFHLMSRRRGLGFYYYMKHFKDIFGKFGARLVIYNGQKAVRVSVPTQFWNWLMQDDEDLYYKAKLAMRLYVKNVPERDIAHIISIQQSYFYRLEHEVRRFENGELDLNLLSTL